MKHIYCIVGPSATDNSTLAANLEKFYGMKQGSDVQAIAIEEVASMQHRSRIPIVVYLYPAGFVENTSVFKGADMIFRLSKDVEAESFANLVYREICLYEIDTLNETLCAFDKEFSPWIYMKWPANADPDLPQFVWTEGEYTSEPSYSLDETSDSAYAAAKHTNVRTLLRLKPPSDNAKLLQTIGSKAIRTCADFCDTEDIQIAIDFCEAHKTVNAGKLVQGMDEFYDLGLSIEQMDAVDDAFFSFSFLRGKANAAINERSNNE